MKVVVVGGGPAGYVAAIRAAQLGAEVKLIELGELGGECTNWACIPSKTLLHVVDLYKLAADGEAMGLAASPRLNWKALQKWRETVVARLRSGVAYLLKTNGVEVVKAEASPGGDREVVAGEERIKTDALILATGSSPSAPPGVSFSKRVLDTRGALTLEELPSTVLVVGGGAAGVELATIFAKAGAEVHLVEVMDVLLPSLDKDLGQALGRYLAELGVRVRTSTKVASLKEGPGGVEAVLTGPSEEKISVEYVVVATGRRPRLGHFAAMIKTDERGHAVVDGQMRTSLPWVYAAGDVAGPPYFAHKAYAQGKVAAEAAMGKRSYYEPLAVPSVVFSDPEVVSVGLTEEEAKAAGIKASSVKVPLSISGRAAALGDTRGYVKLVYDTESRRVLGVHGVGRGLSELAGEASVLVEFHATLDDLALVIHPHPTLSELLVEAAELALKRPTHVAKL
ncbi:MAG: dihydrolipoyl dehydrogenase [Pyrobaculum sp.]